MSQIRADVELKLAGVELRHQQLRMLSLKAVTASIGAGSAMMGAVLAIMTYVLRHTA